MSRHPHIFISYRRRQSATGANPNTTKSVGYGTQVSEHLYSWLKSNLKSIFPKGSTLFYDNQRDENSLQGNYYKRIKKEISKATHVLLLLPPGAFERCYAADDESNPHDVLGFEIRDALRRKQCEIIPIFIVESEEDAETGKNFTDANGNIISDYSALPDKFRKEAEQRGFLGFQRYAVPLRQDIVIGGIEDKNLARHWDTFFIRNKIIREADSRLPAYLFLALLAVTGTAAIHFLFPKLPSPTIDSDLPENNILSEETPVNNPVTNPNPQESNNVPEDSGKIVSPLPAENPIPTKGESPSPNPPPPDEIPEKSTTTASSSGEKPEIPGEAPSRKNHAIVEPDADTLKKFNDALNALAYASEMGETAEKERIEDNIKIIRACLKYNLPPEVINSRSNSMMGAGRTLLHCAVIYGDANLVRELLEKGASTTAEDEWGKTPLSLAKERKDEKTINLLNKESEPESNATLKNPGP